MTLGWRGNRRGINRGEDLWRKDGVKSERSEGGAKVKQHAAAFFSFSFTVSRSFLSGQPVKETAQRIGFYFHKSYLWVGSISSWLLCVCSPGQDPVLWRHSDHTVDEGGPLAMQLCGRTGTHN